MKRLILRARNVLVRLIHLAIKTFWIRGDRVLSGPFEGMLYEGEFRRSASLPKVLGTYEMELSPILQSAIVSRNYRVFLDIGCADGYFLVGMARAQEDLSVIGSDISRRALDKAAVLARRNCVASRVKLVGPCDHQSLNSLIQQDTLLFCDVEGAEYHLLDPIHCPQLLNTDLIVEVHEFSRPGLGDALISRFSATHSPTKIPINYSIRVDHAVRRRFGIPRALWAVATFEMRNSTSHWLYLKRPRQ